MCIRDSSAPFSIFNLVCLLAASFNAVCVAKDCVGTWVRVGVFAGGALILLFKPFKVGDLIEAQGSLGVVTEIQIFVTKLLTPDNKEVIIPNGTLSNGNITNYSSTGNLRVDLTVGISYNDDIDKAISVITETLKADPKVLQTPAPTVAVGELADSSVNILVRPHATVENYWDVYFNSLKNVKIALDKAGIEIPFPQTVMHQAKS